LIKDLINTTKPNDKKIILIDIKKDLLIIKTKYNEELAFGNQLGSHFRGRILV
jgi:hypothetical protein